MQIRTQASNTLLPNEIQTFFILFRKSGVLEERKLNIKDSSLNLTFVFAITENGHTALLPV
jgi:hypothetical protein